VTIEHRVYTKVPGQTGLVQSQIAGKHLNGAPVYAWDVGYVSEKNPAIRFTKTKERVLVC
jgi:hypothetical protein